MSYGTFMGDPATSTLEEPTIKTPSEIETISNQEKDLATKKFLEQQEPRDREETMNPSKSEDQEESLDLEPSLNPDEPPSPPGSSSSKESSKSEKSLNSGSGSDSETSFVFDRTSDSEEAPNSKASPDLTWIETDSKFNEGCDPTQRNEHDKTNDMEDEEVSKHNNMYGCGQTFTTLHMTDLARDAINIIEKYEQSQLRNR